jgi:hypothetical protein
VWRERALLVRSVSLLPVLTGPMVLWLLTALSDAPGETHWMTPQEKFLQLSSPFINYVLPLDLISAALIFGAVTLGVATSRITLAPRAIAAVAELAALYVALPFDLMATSFLDTRIAIMLGFLLFAAVDPTRLPRKVRLPAGIGLTVLFVVRMAVLAEVWTEHRRDLADLRTVIAAVPPGASVVMTNVPLEEAPAYWNRGPRSRLIANVLRTEYHLPALLLIERGAFWPLLFANPAQQPIRLRPAYARLARKTYNIPSHAALVADPDRGCATLRDFDFVLMLEAGADPNLSGFVPKCLTLLARTDFAALFRMRGDAVPR